MSPRRRFLFPAALAVVALSLACDSGGPTAPTTPNGTTGTVPAFPTAMAPLTESVVADMERAIQDEYHAEQIYVAVLEDFGEVIPFANVVRAEARHSESIARSFSNHEMTAPPSEWTLENVPRFGSIPEACAAAVVEEERNIAMYDELLGHTLPQDVRNVFSSNRDASLSSHLPAFRLCAGN